MSKKTSPCELHIVLRANMREINVIDEILEEEVHFLDSRELAWEYVRNQDTEYEQVMMPGMNCIGEHTPLLYIMPKVD